MGDVCKEIKNDLERVLKIADYWGIDKAAPEFNDDKGISLVLTNNDVGQEIFESVKNCIKWKETRLEDSDSMQAAFPKSERDTFWNDFSCKKFECIAKKYVGTGLKNRIKRKFRSGICKIKPGFVKIMELSKKSDGDSNLKERNITGKTLNERNAYFIQ